MGHGGSPQGQANETSAQPSRAPTGDALPPLTGTIFQANPQLPSPSGPVRRLKGSQYGQKGSLSDALKQKNDKFVAVRTAA